MSVNLTLETLASKGINDSTVSGATIKDALETLALLSTPSLIPLVTTITDCENTAATVDIISVAIPIGSLAVGDIIVLRPMIHRLQNSGGSISLSSHLIVDGVSIISIGTASVANSANVYRFFQQSIFQVVSISGDTVTIGFAQPNSGSVITTASIAFAFGATTSVNGAMTFTTTFTTDNTVGATIDIRVQWASANANAWIRMQEAQAYIIKKAV